MHVGTNQGYRLPQGLEIWPGCIVFLPRSPHALFGLLAFPLVSPVRASLLHLLRLPFPFLPLVLGFSSARRRAFETRSPRPSSPFLLVFSSLPPSSSSSSSPLFLMVSISHLHFSSYSMLFHAWPTARNRGSYRDYVHLECTHYRPSAPRNDSPFSLCVTP